VAINLLPDELARDPDRLARFEREAAHELGVTHRDLKPANIRQRAPRSRGLVSYSSVTTAQARPAPTSATTLLRTAAS